MARDDLHVIVYQILSYLYQQMKEGREVDEKKIDEHAPAVLLDIHHVGAAQPWLCQRL